MLIPEELKTAKNEEVIQETLREVGENFSKSMQKSLSKSNVLILNSILPPAAVLHMVIMQFWWYVSLISSGGMVKQSINSN